jgi:hypothetical protein
MNDLELKTDKIQDCIESLMHDNRSLSKTIDELKKKEGQRMDKPSRTGWEDMMVEEFKWSVDDGADKPASENKCEKQSDTECTTNSFSDVARQMGVTGSSLRGRGGGRGSRGGSAGLLKPHNPAVQRLRRSNVSLDRTSDSESNVSDASYQMPRYQVRKIQRSENKRRKFIEGKSTSKSGKCAFRGAPEPSRELFIYRVDGDTQLKVLKSFVTDSGFTIRELSQISHEKAVYKSFKLTVPLSEFKDLFDDDLWPEGVRVRKYITPPSPGIGKELTTNTLL